MTYNVPTQPLAINTPVDDSYACEAHSEDSCSGGRGDDDDDDDDDDGDDVGDGTDDAEEDNDVAPTERASSDSSCSVLFDDNSSRRRSGTVILIVTLDDDAAACRSTPSLAANTRESRPALARTCSSSGRHAASRGGTPAPHGCHCVATVTLVSLPSVSVALHTVQYTSSPSLMGVGTPSATLVFTLLYAAPPWHGTEPMGHVPVPG